MRHLRSRASFGALLSAAALLIGNAVQADISPVFTAATPSAGGCLFSYDVSAGPGTRVNTGDFFTIYDFAGFTGVTFSPADWSPSFALVGPPAFQQSITEDGSIVNITFTYTGVAPLLAPGFIGTFSAESSLCTEVVGQYASQFHKHNPGSPENNLPGGSSSSLVVPGGNVPETSSLMLLVPGLVPLGMMLRRRARK